MQIISVDQRVEPRERRLEVGDGRVDVVALVDPARGDARALHHPHEVVAALDRERVQPRRARAVRRALHEPHAVEAGERVVVRGGVRLVPPDDRVDDVEVGESDRGVDVVHVELEAELRDVGLAAEVGALALAVDAVPAQELAPAVEVVVGDHHEPAVAAGEVLDRLEAEHRGVAVRAEVRAVVGGAPRVGAVLHHHRPEPEAVLRAVQHRVESFQVHRVAAPVHEHDRPRGGRDLRLEVVEVHVAVRRVDVHPLDAEPVGEDRPVGGRAGERRGEHFVAVGEHRAGRRRPVLPRIRCSARCRPDVALLTVISERVPTMSTRRASNSSTFGPWPM